MDEDEHKAELKLATRRYEVADAAATTAREKVVAAVINALRGGVAPTTVTELSPFTATYVRQLARSAGIPAAATKRPPRRHSPAG